LVIFSDLFYRVLAECPVVIDRLLQQLQLLFGLAQLLEHATLLEDRVRLQQILACLVWPDQGGFRVVAHDYHQNSYNLLRLRQLGACLPEQVSFKHLDFLQLLQRLLEVTSLYVDKCNVAFDFARAHIVHAVRSLINLEGLLEVAQSLFDQV